MTRVGRGRYLRLNPPMPRGVKMDSSAEADLQLLRAQTEEYLRTEPTVRRMNELLRALGLPPPPGTTAGAAAAASTAPPGAVAQPYTTPSGLKPELKPEPEPEPEPSVQDHRVVAAAPVAAVAVAGGGAARLPAHWERRVTPEGRQYYVDHSTQTTHWDLPPGSTAEV